MHRRIILKKACGQRWNGILRNSDWWRALLQRDYAAWLKMNYDDRSGQPAVVDSGPISE